MKKVIDFKEVMIILVSIVLITICTTVDATGGLVLGNNTTTIDSNEYDNAQTVPEENTTNNIVNSGANNTTNNTVNNVANNSSNNTANNVKGNNTTDLPQTGIEDYNIGILLIVCVASAIYAYKKVGDYRNI